MSTQPIHTIETDSQSPYGRPQDPPAEWVYRDRQEAILRRRAALVGIRLHQAEYRGPIEPDLPQFPRKKGSKVAYAQVNHNRWIVECPICPSAQVASETDRRFFCLDCFNGGEDGYFEVLFPDDRAEIEAALTKRPDPTTRNWYPGEDVEKLKLENVAHGLDHP